ncbi:MAG: hypothetical protein AABY52_06325 [Deltaproteobacteria bacterium]
MTSDAHINQDRCLMCGVGEIGTDNCSACTWPYSRAGWQRFRRGVKRITIDTGCINAKRKNEFLNKFEEWESQGKIQIQRATPFLEEFKGPPKHVEKAKDIETHPSVIMLDVSILGDGSVLAGPDLREAIQPILFPHTRTLTRNQLNDLRHLHEHIETGGDIFVTLNTNDFIANSKQELLKKLGVWVLTPKETVDLIRDIYGWS